MATTTNLGRVQGGGFFGSTSTSETNIPVASVTMSGVSPLAGDTIVNANGVLCRINEISGSNYAVTKYGTLKSSGIDPEAVRYVPQTLTDAQKLQARENIDALSGEDVSDTKTTQTNTTTNANYRLILSNAASDTTETNGVRKSYKFNANPSTGIITAPTFKGNLNGNATSATKATQDGNGKNIANTYLPLTGGLMSGPLAIDPGDIENYREGLRINKANNGWSGVYMGNNPGTTEGNSENAGSYLIATHAARGRLIFCKCGTENATDNNNGVTIDGNNYLYENGRRVVTQCQRSWTMLKGWGRVTTSTSFTIYDYNQYAYLEFVASNEDTLDSGRTTSIITTQLLRDNNGVKMYVSRDGASLQYRPTFSGNNVSIRITDLHYCNYLAVFGIK